MRLLQTECLVYATEGETVHTPEALEAHIRRQMEHGWEMVSRETDLWTDGGVIHNFIWRRDD